MTEVLFRFIISIIHSTTPFYKPQVYSMKFVLSFILKNQINQLNYFLLHRKKFSTNILSGKLLVSPG